ncbi:MAG: hypothetical protein HQL84_14940 [Magnetococcales bacterium]|nr:hypothetical protein [Magnetococcales bacterium]MBF0151315.1 hypothetical protein [Magnetococcales bacterium]MBF0174221.1 hypothetical protein [Magnetococcales bacterium]MBF0347252.1 hypothetical protein [Magnetococcales bacterium]MBF0632218.1 hypothetical protein [Magnetococcales bacterium]
MIPLQIVIKKDSYAIARTFDEQELVSDIRRMEDALSIFHELTHCEGRPEDPEMDEASWQVVPGCLSLH